ncbi:MAG: hypothetical protein K0R59_2646 [Sphingobacterium sp.]|jgi:hypothetical protein|nr:hypothetical protein [Sphingobacterium sp.]
MSTIITYDIPSKHREFKEKMFSMGYKETFKDHKGLIVYLPNTTLLHENKDATSAKDDAKKVCLILNISLGRCISSQFGPDWAGIYGIPLI